MCVASKENVIMWKWMCYWKGTKGQKMEKMGKNLCLKCKKKKVNICLFDFDWFVRAPPTFFLFWMCSVFFFLCNVDVFTF